MIERLLFGKLTGTWEGRYVADINGQVRFRIRLDIKTPEGTNDYGYLTFAGDEIFIYPDSFVDRLKKWLDMVEAKIRERPNQ